MSLPQSINDICFRPSHIPMKAHSSTLLELDVDDPTTWADLGDFEIPYRIVKYCDKDIVYKAGKIEMTALRPIGDVAYKYNSDATYFTRINIDDNISSIQLVCESGSISYTVQCSLDGVNWVDFDPTLSDSLTGPDSNIITFTNVAHNAAIKIAVTSTGGIYYACII